MHWDWLCACVNMLVVKGMGLNCHDFEEDCLTGWSELRTKGLRMNTILQRKINSSSSRCLT